MASFYEALDDKLTAFIAEQPMFFVATAARDGHVNLSPKGSDSFRVLGPNSACYLDFTGSGNETAAHLLENGRMTVMFNSFARNPRILRLFGQGHVAARGTSEWKTHEHLFDSFTGARQMVFLDIEMVQTSCGFGVPLMRFEGHRDTMRQWAEAKGEDGLKAYRAQKNRTSLDGLPTGLQEE